MIGAASSWEIVVVSLKYPDGSRTSLQERNYSLKSGNAIHDCSGVCIRLIEGFW